MPLQLPQPLCPLGLLEAHQNEIAAHQQRSLHQHPIRGQKLQHLLLAHARQLVLQPHGLIQQPAGVEKSLQRQPAALMPRSQLLIAGVLLLDVPQLIADVVLIQPLLRLLAGTSLGIANKNHGSLLLFH